MGEEYGSLFLRPPCWRRWLVYPGRAIAGVEGMHNSSLGNLISSWSYAYTRLKRYFVAMGQE